MKVFIPINEDMLDQLNANEEIVPYQVGVSLLSQLNEKPASKSQRVNRGEAPEHRPSAHSVLPPYPR